jgi:hypothetical protein
MHFPSPDARVFTERVCSVQGQLSLPMAFIDQDLDKFVSWNSRFLKSLSFDSIRKRTSPSRQGANQRWVRFGRPGKLNEKQICLELRLLEKRSPAKRAAGTLAIGMAIIYRFVFETQLREYPRRLKAKART